MEMRPLFTKGTEIEQWLVPHSWSPDGLSIACIGGNEDELWIVSKDGKNYRKVAEPGYFWHHFEWSPESKHIAFETSDGLPWGKEKEIYIVDLETDEQQHLVDIIHPGGLGAWTANGERVI